MKATFLTARPATLRDIDRAARNLHPHTRRELEAAGYAPDHGLYVLVATTEEVHVLGDGLAICGVRCHGSAAEVWVAMCRDAPRHGLSLLRWSRRAVQALLDDGYDEVRTHVYVENTDVLRWVKWLGFAILPPKPYGGYGELFHRVELRR